MWAVRRAQWLALGLTDADMEKPKIAIVNSSSELVNKGLVVGEVTPEAAIGGAIGLVEDGDTIVIDVEKRTCDLLVADDVLAARRGKLKLPGPPADNSWTSIYERSVLPLSKGAALVGRK